MKEKRSILRRCISCRKILDRVDMSAHEQVDMLKNIATNLLDSSEQVWRLVANSGELSMDTSSRHLHRLDSESAIIVN